MTDGGLAAAAQGHARSRPEWKEYQEKTPGLSVFVDGARRRAHEADRPRVPAGLRGGRAVARRGAAQALLAAGRARTRRCRAATRSSPAEADRRVAVARRAGAVPRPAGVRRDADRLAVGHAGRRDHPRAQPRPDGLGAAAELPAQSDLVTPSTGSGCATTRALLHDPTFRGAVEHTLLYTVAFVPLSIAGGLGIALLLNRRVRFIGLYRTLVFVPVHHVRDRAGRAVLVRVRLAVRGRERGAATTSGSAARASSRIPGRRCGCWC